MFSDEDLDLERLRATLMQETQMKDMVEESCNELAVTVAELEKRYEGIEDESNEWKTRFEIQQEINEQLRKQIVILQEKVMQASKTSKDIQRIVKSNTITTEFGSATPNMIKLLQKEKNGLINQRKDIDWRVDQEAKAYHKANEERKNIQEEINQINANLGEIRKSNALTAAAGGGDAGGAGSRPKSPRGSPKRSIGQRNIPPDQRVLDPRKGPIKKTAAVKQLPSL